MKPKYSRYYTYIKPVIENKTVRSAAPYIFSLITIALLAIFAIRPTISTILNLQKNIENNRQTFEALQNKTQSLIEGKKNLDALNSEAKTKINKSLPAQADVTTLIRSLQTSTGTIASVSALQIQPVTLMDNTTSVKSPLLNLGELNFSYNVQGSFSQLIAVLQNLQKTPRLINISTAVINKQTDGSTVLSISGKAYYLK